MTSNPGAQDATPGAIQGAIPSATPGAIPSASPSVVVAPERETPGMSASACAKPSARPCG